MHPQPASSSHSPTPPTPPTSGQLNRRRFLQTSAAAVACTALTQPARVLGANDRLRVGIMGLNGRGQAHIAGFLAASNVEIAYVCDVDHRTLDRSVAAVAKSQSTRPQAVRDFRRMLEDPTVDAISIATPNHWHAPAAILACAAGKHVYVEKPGSHNGDEAERIVNAARTHRRVVQMGNQRRSWPWVIEAIARVRAGEIGRVTMARCWYNNARGTIGRGKLVPVPDWLDFDLWQGPAPVRPYLDNLVHYHWHWRWHWGGGELANNGIHALDLARWGLHVDFPNRVTCAGGRYQFQDDQETPDIYLTTYDYGDRCITWESQSCHPQGFHGEGFGVQFYGDRGSLAILGDRARILDEKGKLKQEIPGSWNDKDHFADFCHAVREGTRPHSEIGDCQKSTILCHLGNIAYRTGGSLEVNPATGHPAGSRAAQRLWTREYRRGWDPRA